MIEKWPFLYDDDMFQVGASFNAIMEKKTELSTFLDQKEDRRKRLPINTKDNFWLVSLAATVLVC